MASAGELEATAVYPLRTGTAAAACPSLDFIDSVRIVHSEMADSRYGTEEAALASTKTELDAVPAVQYYYARDKIFPLSHSGVNARTHFRNRAGHKLNQTLEATLVWDQVLTCGRRVVFVDICGGPGAFSQALYASHPKSATLEGYGMTLMDSHVGAPNGWYPELREKHNFGATFGIDGTGDIYRRDNVEAFLSLVRDRSVSLAVADGGFELPPEEMNLQEPKTARIVFAQWYVAIRALCRGGSFVLKLFDTFTPFSRSLLWLTTQLFDTVTIVKPLHSRVVNSERYLSAVGFRGVDADWVTYLDAVHARGFTEAQSVAHLVPPSVIAADAAFLETMDLMVRAVVSKQVAALRLVLDSQLIKEQR